MDISNRSALFIGILINVVGVALEALGIEVAAWPLLIFSILGIIFVLIKNFQDSKHTTEVNEPLPKEPHVYDILDDCDYDALSKWYINPVTDEIFCFKCWHENKSKIPIAKDGINLSSWICPKCNKPYTSAVRTLKKLYIKNPSASMIRRQHEKSRR